jgi:demethylmenaquinone methyltransferase / 2-methoxy-6-polyprenyl-1,4-benzoquinol methylase
MFDAIAGRYDFLNHVLSGGLDLYWRRRMLASLRLTGQETLLDVCTGTADVALGARARRDGARRVIGLDFARAMLARGHGKVLRKNLSGSIALVQGDATILPVRDASIDAVTVAFGIRNVADPLKACSEMVRVLRPAGRLAILEFSMPRRPIIAGAYAFYFRHILPRIGRAISGHRAAYSYLPASVGAFPASEQFAASLRQAGFVDVEAAPLSLGTVHLYTAVAPELVQNVRKSPPAVAPQPAQPAAIIV